MDSETRINRTLRQNIEEFDRRRRETHERLGTGERLSVAVTRFAGSAPFLALHAVMFGAWALVNLAVIPGLPRFDPSLVMMATFASVEAIFISTFVLIAQNRMATAAERRAELDLHMSLLVEAELSQLANLTLRVAEKLGVEAPEPEILEVAERVDPGEVLDELERRGGEE